MNLQDSLTNYRVQNYAKALDFIKKNPTDFKTDILDNLKREDNKIKAFFEKEKNIAEEAFRFID